MKGFASFKDIYLAGYMLNEGNLKKVIIKENNHKLFVENTEQANEYFKSNFPESFKDIGDECLQDDKKSEVVIIQSRRFTISIQGYYIDSGSDFYVYQLSIDEDLNYIA